MNALKNSALKNASPVILLLISLIFPCYPPVIFPVILLLFWNAENIVKIKNSILKNENKINVLRSFVPQDDKVNHGEMVMLNLFQHRTNSESIILKSSAFVWDAETSSA